jgi:hypothetical protein
MRPRAAAIQFKAQVAHRHEANPLLVEPGSTVLVHRGVARSIAMKCPDGCGEQLTINLDSRSGPAWRYYLNDQQLSLFPSVWRDTGCKSHFIVWRSKIYWCDWDELDAPSEETIEATRLALTPVLTSYVAIADRLNLVPWGVLSACRRLCRMGVAESGVGEQQSHFRRQ